MLQNHQQGSLAVTIHSADQLDDVEMMGKNDAYTRISLNLQDPKSFQKTFVDKNGGTTPKWNQTLTLENLKPEYTELYVEIMEEDAGADAPIGFLAIPLNQVLQAPQHNLAAVFDVFTPTGKQQGQISLTIRLLGAGQASSHGGQAGHIAYEGSQVKGQSHMTEDHKKRIKSIKNKETAQDAGVAALGGLAAIGAGFLANQFQQTKKQQELEKRDAALADDQ